MARRLLRGERPARRRPADSDDVDDGCGPLMQLLVPGALGPLVLVVVLLTQLAPDSGMQHALSAARSLEAGQYRLAETELHKALALVPTVGRVYTQLGITLVAQDRREEALESFQAATELSPADPHPRRLAASAANTIATRLLASRGSREAQTVLRRALVSSPR